MLAAESKVVPAPARDTSSAEPAYSWKEIVDPVEPFLNSVNHRLAEQVDSFDQAIVPYADYALNGQGKHMRPALVALTARALGKIGDSHVTVAVIIEMVHLATLVHDDVMDEAEIRRRRSCRPLGERDRRFVWRLPLCPGGQTRRQFSDPRNLPRGRHGHQHRFRRRNPANTASP